MAPTPPPIATRLATATPDAVNKYLKTPTKVMMVLGVIAAVWFGMGRDART
jgi:hypothetical protein